MLNIYIYGTRIPFLYIFCAFFMLVSNEVLYFCIPKQVKLGDKTMKFERLAHLFLGYTHEPGHTQC